MFNNCYDDDGDDDSFSVLTYKPPKSEAVFSILVPHCTLYHMVIPQKNKQLIINYKLKATCIYYPGFSNYSYVSELGLLSLRQKQAHTCIPI